MVAHRRKDLITSRRRVEDEGEEEAGSEMAPLEDDSLSEGTALSDLDDDDADADGSDISEQEDAEAKSTLEGKDVTGNGHVGVMNGATKDHPGGISTGKNQVAAIGREDTEAMRNGLQKSQVSQEVDEVDFEDMKENGVEASTTSANGNVEAQSTTHKSDLPPHERRRREQEEYKRKRDEDPTFVPNRGGFFMHDHRHPGPAANGFRPFGRGRGRGAITAPFSQTK